MGKARANDGSLTWPTKHAPDLPKLHVAFIAGGCDKAALTILIPGVYREGFGTRQAERYMGKISGPLLDRIDLHIEVPAVAFKDLSTAPPGNSSDVMRQKVLAARSIQRQRFDGAHTRYNAQMSTREIRKHCRLDEDCLAILRSSVNELGLSARAHDKVLRVACTIADLDGSSAIQPSHIQEAINDRMLDRNLWT